MVLEDTYIAEKVVSKRIRKGKAEYLVKWEGWPSSQNTWEPTDHLSGCLDLIEDYEDRRSKKGRPSKRTSASEDKNSSLNKSGLNKSSSRKRARLDESSKTSDLSKSNTLADDTSNDSEETIETSSDEKSNENEFQKKRKPKEIVAAVNSEDGVYCFLINREDSDEPDLVPAKEAHKECPQLVIQFYEKRISWRKKT